MAVETELGSQKEQKFSDLEFPHRTSNLFSQLWFLWLNPLVGIGYKRAVEDGDLWHPDQEQSSVIWNEKLESAWIVESQNQEPRLSNALWKLLFKDMVTPGIFKLLSDMCSSLSPLLIRAAVDYVSNWQLGVNSDVAIGFYMVTGLFLMQLVGSLLNNQFFHRIQTLSLSVRSAFYAMVFKKSTKLTAKSRANFDSGKVTNIITSDVARIEDFMMVANMAWTAPIQLVIIIALLCIFMGPSALAGVAVLLVLGPMQKKLMGLLMGIRIKVAPLTDERVNKTQEVIEGIRIVKYFAWEDLFFGRIFNVRNQELSLVLKKGLYIAFVTVIAFAIPTFAATIAFVIYGSTRKMEAGEIFGSLALFQQLRFPLMFLPRVLASYSEFKVSVARLQGILNAEELDFNLVIDNTMKDAIVVEDGSFIWDTNDQANSTAHKIVVVGDSTELEENDNEQNIRKDFKVENINLNIPKGSLIAIVGPGSRF